MLSHDYLVLVELQLHELSLHGCVHAVSWIIFNVRFKVRHVIKMCTTPQTYLTICRRDCIIPVGFFSLLWLALNHTEYNLIYLFLIYNIYTCIHYSIFISFQNLHQNFLINRMFSALLPISLWCWFKERQCVQFTGLNSSL